MVKGESRKAGVLECLFLWTSPLNYHGFALRGDIDESWENMCCLSPCEMPPKRSQSKGKSSSSEQCMLCCQKVVEGKDEVIFCGGKCRGWFHHYCAGISLASMNLFKLNHSLWVSQFRFSALCVRSRHIKKK